MKNIFTRNAKSKLVAFAISTVVYLSLQLLSMTLLCNVYTFAWLAQHFYCFTWLPVLVLIAFDKTFISYFITFGNLAGAIIGELVGSFSREQRMSQITDNMSVEEIHERSIHFGVLIWLVSILAFLAVGIVLNIVRSKRQKLSAA